MVYKIPKEIQDKIPEHYIYIENMEITVNKQQRQRITENKKGTRSNQPRGFTRIHLTIHLFIQQKEI